MRLDENILRIKEVMGLITEQEQPKVFEINLGNLFDSGKYILNQQVIASINGAILKLREFAKKTPTTPVVVSVESSESKVPNYDREKFPSTGDRNVDFTDDKKLGVGALSALRAKSIEDYLNKTLRVPNAKIVVVNKGAQGPIWKTPFNANDPAYTANQYVKLLAKLETPVATQPTTDYTKVTKEMILTGSYYCNGKNSKGVVASANVYEPQCKLLPQNFKDGKHMSVYETKWNENVVKDAYVRPLLRWSFTWGSNNKIVNITRIEGLKNGENTTTKDISGNDPEMIYYLNINGTDVYSTYIKPNLG
jgi:outer membrane protein OmpA-like peptidoglycan-associated protein